MHPVKKIEIIASSMELKKILAILDRVGVPGYSFIKNVEGKSSWGAVSSDMDIGSSKLGNVYIICFCPPEMVKPIVTDVKPILNKFGGVCYLTDSLEITSIRCLASS